MDRGYPHSLIKEKKLLSEIKFTERESALLKQNNKEGREIKGSSALRFATQY